MRTKGAGNPEGKPHQTKPTIQDYKTGGSLAGSYLGYVTTTTSQSVSQPASASHTLSPMDPRNVQAVRQSRRQGRRQVGRHGEAVVVVVLSCLLLLLLL